VTLETVPAELEVMRNSLALELAALYLPAGHERCVFERCAVAAAANATREAVARLVFDAAAWQLVMHGAGPLVVCGGGAWLVEHPFTPPASAWLLMPVGTDRLVIGTPCP
jgi:hypothetical protein